MVAVFATTSLDVRLLALTLSLGGVREGLVLGQDLSDHLAALEWLCVTGFLGLRAICQRG